MEDYEVKVPFQSLHALGCHVDAVCPSTKAGSIAMLIFGFLVSIGMLYYYYSLGLAAESRRRCLTSCADLC
ncbi:protein DJ-1-like D-like [Trifolium medium]|uniref:Protein DJ-1-like D-like n=1 Tax=Trifolium medium TaxID=97028 RepID=A0A392QW12_9FABA|nr:protein DJ-1-like D-like [Trifolium medium]